MSVLLDERTPTWVALRLDGHLSRQRAALVPYFVLLVSLWLSVAGVWPMSDAVFNVCASAFALTYLILVGEAYYIQKVMHDSAVYGHGAWQIVVGAVVLNPCVLGWWMPVSVLLAAARVRSDLDAFERKRKAQGRSVMAAAEPSVAPRSVGVSWKGTIRGVILATILLLILALAWHLAQVPKPH